MHDILLNLNISKRLLERKSMKHTEVCKKNQLNLENSRALLTEAIFFSAHSVHLMRAVIWQLRCYFTSATTCGSSSGWRPHKQLALISQPVSASHHFLIVLSRQTLTISIESLLRYDDGYRSSTLTQVCEICADPDPQNTFQECHQSC